MGGETVRRFVKDTWIGIALAIVVLLVYSTTIGHEPAKLKAVVPEVTCNANGETYLDQSVYLNEPIEGKDSLGRSPLIVGYRIIGCTYFGRYYEDNDRLFDVLETLVSEYSTWTGGSTDLLWQSLSNRAVELIASDPVLGTRFLKSSSRGEFTMAFLGYQLPPKQAASN